MNEDEFEKLLNYLLAEHAKGSALAAAYLLAVDTGVRRGELAGFQIGDYRKIEKAIRSDRTLAQVKGRCFYKQHKNRSSKRSLELDQDTCRYLDEHIACQKKRLLDEGIKQTSKTPLFAHSDGSWYTPAQLTDGFTRIVRKLELDPATHLHTVRHTNASYLLADGMDIKTLSERFGHAKPTTTLGIYSHLMPGRTRIAAERFVSIRKRIMEGAPDGDCA